MQSKTIWLNLLLLLSALCLTGCFSSNPADIEAFSKPTKVIVTAEKYVMQPPDEIQIFCTKVPEIHEQTQRIRPDGMVSFEGVGEMRAAGRTPKELADVLRERVMLLYALPGENPIDVRIMVYRSGFYYVQGQVYLPGPKIYTGRDTVFDALSNAQPNPMAWLGRIQVIRPSSEKNIPPKIFEVDFDRMEAHGDISKNVLLQEGDIIYVPPTVMAAIGLKVEEFVRPIGRAFSTVNIVEPGRQYDR
ncbi:MAG: polysaccharide biosynthesis/export family protein [Planctomycetota bacterium]|nr:MAG: polysaccharide biosynthesis/export family protein [Planctomycetota bacterium]